MGYYIDLDAIDLEMYMQMLKTEYLAPSRQKIKDDIDENFERVGAQGIANAAQLLITLKTKTKVSDFASKSGIPEAYLTILSREVRSYIKKQIMLSSFSIISSEAVEKLSAMGLNNASAIYDKVLTHESRAQLAKLSGVEADEVLVIAKLVDLSRIRWVNHTFAQMLLAVGYESAKQVAQADGETLHRQINEINKRQDIYKGAIGLNDIRICVAAADKLEHEIKF